MEKRGLASLIGQQLEQEVEDSTADVCYLHA